MKNEVVAQEISSADFENADLSVSLHPLGDYGEVTSISASVTAALKGSAVIFLILGAWVSMQGGAWGSWITPQGNSRIPWSLLPAENPFPKIPNLVFVCLFTVYFSTRMYVP